MSKPTKKQNFRFLVTALLSVVVIFLFITFISSQDRLAGSHLRQIMLWESAQGETKLPLALPQTVGQTVEIRATLPELQFADCLIFRTENLAVSVSLDGQLLYSSTLPLAHRTLGDEWHMVPLPPEKSGKTVSITSTVLYTPGSNPVSAVYLGSQSDFLQNLLRNHLPSYMVSILLFLSGIAFLFSSRMIARRDLRVQIPWSFALLCATLGLWCAMQTEVPEILYGRTTFLHFITYSPLPFALALAFFFLRTLPAPKWLLAAYLWLGMVELLAWVVTIAGETFRFAAYVETLPQTRLALYALIVLFILQIPSLLKEFRTYFYMVLGFTCIAVMVIADIFSAYAGTYDYARNTRFGLLLMTVLIALQYGVRVRESVKRADEADLMRRLAYRDSLTGLHNRLALVRDQERLLAQGRSCVGIVQMDINNLKQVNDQFGHEQGDALILRAAKAIRTAFNDVGTCYRVGGDEFVALLTETDCEATYRECAEKLTKACEEQNENQTHLLSIALGFAMYNAEADEQFFDLVRIADMRMYERKREMKAQIEAEAQQPDMSEGSSGL